MTLVQRLMPHALAALVILIVFTGKLSDNWVVMLAQLYAYLIICVHIPVLIGLLCWNFIKWQWAVLERRRAEAAMAQQRRPRVFTSLWFINGIVLFGFGWGLALFLLRVFPADARDAFAELLTLLGGIEYWGLISIPALWICELLVGAGTMLMLIPVGFWGWQETRRRIGASQSVLRNMRP